MDRRFKDEHGDEWYVHRQPPTSFASSPLPGNLPKGTRRPGFKFKNLNRSEMRFLKEEDAPKDLNLEKSHEEELRRLLDLATPI